MFIPISTDTSVRRTPWVNYGLIVANLLVFLSMHMTAGVGPKSALGMMVNHVHEDSVLDASVPRLYQFITYQFLHANFAHIAGNLLFLWLFGNAVNAKMGHICYLLFYLAGGVFAGAGYALLGDHPLVGASGSISAVTTAYLVLFPRSYITVLYWWFLIGTFQIRSMWMILFKLILWDNVIARSLAGESNVGFDAHLAGYAFGFAATFGMLAARLLPRDQFDLLAILKRSWQRQTFRSAMSSPEAQARARYGQVARPVSVEVLGSSQPPSPPDPLAELRSRIAEALAANDRDGAAGLYEQLLEQDPRQALPRNQQLEVSNQLYTLHRLPQAAAAYEKFLSHYASAPEADHVRLLLGIIYARDLQQYEVAEGHLVAILGRLHDERRREQCVHWLNVIAQAIHGAQPRPGPSA